VDISVIICTRNRGEELARTLQSIGKSEIPDALTVELIVVDNGSTDNTKEVVREARFDRISVEYVHEPVRGQVVARETGMSVATGDIIIFTDDDVRVCANWITAMSLPIRSGTADALAGGVELASHLKRDWMTPTHRSLLAGTETINDSAPERMVGANMSFHRRVLEKISGFDEKLGPGALGFMDDTLFSLQLKEAGFKLRSAFETSLEHHPRPDRLSRKAWLDRAKKQGTSQAYVDYHWLHERVKFPLLKHLWIHLKLNFHRARRYDEIRNPEGAPMWELHLVRGLWYYFQMAKEIRRPRNYAYRGLAKNS
jgi:glycosyltransferase involved in cell wall biosynthesis